MSIMKKRQKDISINLRFQKAVFEITKRLNITIKAIFDELGLDYSQLTRFYNGDRTINLKIINDLEIKYDVRRQYIEESIEPIFKIDGNPRLSPKAEDINELKKEIERLLKIELDLRYTVELQKRTIKEVDEKILLITQQSSKKA